MLKGTFGSGPHPGWQGRGHDVWIIIFARVQMSAFPVRSGHTQGVMLYPGRNCPGVSMTLSAGRFM